MKKKEVYIPQFELPEETKQKTEKQQCYCCGKQTVSLYNGLCFECRQSSQATKSRNQADIDTYLEWVGNKAKTHGKTGSLFFRLISMPIAKYGWAVTWFYVAFIAFMRQLGEWISWVSNNHFNAEEFFFPILFITLLLVAGFLNVSYIKKRRIKKFHKYCNDTVLFTKDYGWRCPCCDAYNLSDRSCETCGVYPHLVNEFENNN